MLDAVIEHLKTTNSSFLKHWETIETARVAEILNMKKEESDLKTADDVINGALKGAVDKIESKCKKDAVKKVEEKVVAVLEEKASSVDDDTKEILKLNKVMKQKKAAVVKETEDAKDEVKTIKKEAAEAKVKQSEKVDAHKEKIETAKTPEEKKELEQEL